MYLASERKEYILKTLSERGSVRTIILAKEMNVTDETVRNDLIHLEECALLQRVHGGAISLKKKVINESLMTNVSTDVNIAKAAIEYIESNVPVFIDGGALGCMTASYVPAIPVTVITNSPAILNRLEGNLNVNVYSTGGILDRKIGLLVGKEAASSLSRIAIDTAFLVPDAYCPKRGAFYQSMEQADFIQSIVPYASRVIVLCPADRLEASAPHLAVEPGQINILVTSEGIDKKVSAVITESGITLRKA